MSANVAGPLLALSLTQSPVSAGWVAAAGTVPSLLLYLPAGVLVDRLKLRHIMMTSQLLRGAMAASLAVLVFVGTRSVPLLTVAAAGCGICMTLYSVAEISVIPQIAPPERLSAAMATNEARSHAALLLGRPLGGLLYGLNRALPFAFDAVSCFVTAWAISHVHAYPQRTASTGRRRGISPLAKELTEGLASLWRDHFLRTALSVCTITNFLFQAVIVLLVVIAKSHGLSTMMIGILLAAPGLGGIIGTACAPIFIKWGQKRVVVVCTWAWSVLIALIALIAHPAAWLVGWGGVGFVGAQMNIALDTYQASHTRRELLGRTVGANRFLSLGAVPFGALCGGYIIAFLGTKITAWFITAVIGTLASMLTMRHFRSGNGGPLDESVGQDGLAHLAEF